jgi:hypothetical protein
MSDTARIIIGGLGVATVAATFVVLALLIRRNRDDFKKEDDK